KQRRNYTRNSPWRVVAVETAHVYQVQNIILGDVHDVHISRLRFYSDKELELSRDLKKTFQYTHIQGGFEMSAIVRLCKEVDEYEVLVHWCGFNTDGSTLEPL
ncbi:unnamed protein product, partial [Discosporangium mesarthrocarpum]